VNRKQADIAVGLLLALIVLLGIVSAVQLQLTGMPMSGQMESVPVIAAFGPALMSLVFVSIIGGVYVYVRSSVFTTSGNGDERGEESSSTAPKDTADSEIGGNFNTQPSKSETNSQILAVLPEDEQRILEPVIESPAVLPGLVLVHLEGGLALHSSSDSYLCGTEFSCGTVQESLQIFAGCLTGRELLSQLISFCSCGLGICC